MPSKLIVRNISKTYKTKGNEAPALSNINLEVQTDEFVSVIGPNGSGKSTLLKIIASVFTPTSGSVAIEGIPAYMPQDHALLPWRTVEENLLLPCDVKRIPRETMRGKIKDLLNEFGLGKYAHQYPASLSGGTRQKIALLRAVLQCNSFLETDEKAPDSRRGESDEQGVSGIRRGRRRGSATTKPDFFNSFLLLDEPFAPLDAITRLEAQTWLLSLVERMHSSVLLITHDIREAIYLSDTIYVFSSGTGTIKERSPVPLPRPRNHGHLQTPEALALEKKLFSLLV